MTNTDGGAADEEQPELTRPPRRPKRGIEAIEAEIRRNYAMFAGVQRELDRSEARLRTLINSVGTPAIEAMESMMQSRISEAAATAERLSRSGLADFNPKLAAMQAREARKIALIAAPALKQWERQNAILNSSMVRWAREYQARMQPLLSHLSEVAERTRLLFLPPNWRGLTQEQCEAAVRLAEEEGIPTAWVPRKKLLLELLDADSLAHRRNILVQRREEISADCLGIAAQVDATELEVETKFAVGLASGLAAEAHDFGTQSGATNMVDRLIRGIAERGETGLRLPSRWKYKNFRTAIVAASDDESFGYLRPGAVLAALIPALEDYWPPAPIPRLYNRHATAHSPGPEQCTPANAIISVMLLVSLLREAEASGW